MGLNCLFNDQTYLEKDRPKVMFWLWTIVLVLFNYGCFWCWRQLIFTFFKSKSEVKTEKQHTFPCFLVPGSTPSLILFWEQLPRCSTLSECNPFSMPSVQNIYQDDPYTTHTWTSSSFRMGMDRTLYFCLSSLERGEDIIFLRMWEGALKCLLRFLLRSEVTKGLNFILTK